MITCLCGNEEILEEKTVIRGIHISTTSTYNEYECFYICKKCGLVYSSPYYNSENIENFHNIIKANVIQKNIENIQ